MIARITLALGLNLAPGGSGAAPTAITVTPEPAPRVIPAALPMRVTGRVTRAARPAAGYLRQWPGTYFETRFRGTSAYFRIGQGSAILRVSVDGAAVARLVSPRPGYYRAIGLAAGAHRLRIDVISESQAGPTGFNGFYAPSGTTPLPLHARARQIEFIGDSHSVGYGNTSPTRDCSEDAVWSTTDTAQGIAALTARRYGADYQVNAISGRGIVRNYNGLSADTLPLAYPYSLFDKASRYRDAGWHPQAIVIALGTNDFSTPLHAGEKWVTREALRADYETTYVRFVRTLRARNPTAFFILWATGEPGGEIETETRIVAERLRAGGESRLAFTIVRGLRFSACNGHPSLSDDRAIADAVSLAIDRRPGVWPRD